MTETSSDPIVEALTALMADCAKIRADIYRRGLSKERPPSVPSTPRPRDWTDSDLFAVVESVTQGDEVVAAWDAHAIMFALRNDLKARIAELEAQLAERPAP